MMCGGGRGQEMHIRPSANVGKSERGLTNVLIVCFRLAVKLTRTFGVYSSICDPAHLYLCLHLLYTSI